MGKIDSLVNYINEADEIISKQDVEAAKRFGQKIIGVYGAEITNIKSGLDTYSMHFGTEHTDYLGDVELLKAKLNNHKENIEENLTFKQTKK